MAENPTQNQQPTLPSTGYLIAGGTTTELDNFEKEINETENRTLLGLADVIRRILEPEQSLQSPVRIWFTKDSVNPSPCERQPSATLELLNNSKYAENLTIALQTPLASGLAPNSTRTGQSKPITNSEVLKLPRLSGHRCLSARIEAPAGL